MLMDSSTKQRIQHRKTEEEAALEQKLFDETRQATNDDEVGKRQRKVCFARLTLNALIE